MINVRDLVENNGEYARVLMIDSQGNFEILDRC